MHKGVVLKVHVIKFAFGCINIGLAAMFLIGVVPVWLAQPVASVQEVLLAASSAELMQQLYLVKFKWLRVIGDTIFAFGTIALAWFIFGLKFGWSLEGEK